MMDFLEASVDEVFRYYRNAGFPQYAREDYNAVYELRKVHYADDLEYFDGHVFRKYQSANGFLFSYFPHWADVRCGNSKSLTECWNDDNLLRQLIEKTKTFCEKHGENWSTNRLRQNAKVYCAKQSVSNFNPVTARLLYDAFAPGGIVYDMSMGWGGRLLGFKASSARTYIGCEPSTKTYQGLRELDRDLVGKETILLNCGSENADLAPWVGSVDFAFTSPPYFDKEKYSDEPTQSYIAYPNMRLWLDCFIRETFARVYAALRPSGVMAINYENNDKVLSQIIDIADSTGFELESQYKYEISSISGDGAKYEPIIVFRKPGDGIKREICRNLLF